MFFGSIKYLFLFFFVFGLALPSFGEEKPIVFVSIVPQKYFVAQLAGDAVEIEVMVLPGMNPATYEPRPSQMVMLSQASVYFSIGVPFEAAWLPRLRSVSPEIVLVATDSGIVKQPITGHHHEGDKDGGEPAAEHTARADPHIWLSPPLVKKQVVTIANSLKTLLPEQADEIDTRKRDFLERIDALNSELHQLFQGKEGLRFMVFHPSWGYFAREYALRQEAVEFSGKSPKPSQLAELVTEARAEGITTVFVQPQFSKKSAELIAREIGGKVVVADPLAYDWLDNLRRVAQLIVEER